MVCIFKDCKYRGTQGCRVHDLGVRGITECVKYKPSEEKREGKE